MKFAELKQNLKARVAPCYMLFGTDIFLVSKSVDLITSNAGVLSPELDVSRVSETAPAETIVNECRTVSFMGGRRVVVVRPVADAQLSKPLVSYLAAPNMQTVLVLVSASEKAPALKNAELVDCNPMSTDLVVKLIANQLNAAGKQITAEAANLLAMCCSNNYAKIDNELNKMTNYYIDKPIITAEDVNAVITKTEEHQIFELGNAITKRDTLLTEKILNSLLSAGVEEYAIFGSLVAHFRRLFYSLRSAGTNESVSAFLKCSPYAVMYARRDNRHLTQKISELYAKVLDFEYQIKSGVIHAQNALSLIQMLA